MTNVRRLVACCLVILGVVNCEKEQWVWKDNAQRSARLDSPRYQIHENLEEFDPEYSIGFRPQHSGPYGPGSRPIVPSYSGNQGVLVGPGGPTGIIGRPGAGHLDRDVFDSGIVPSWIRDDPRYRDYDTCRCRYSFNCPSTGLKFGACSREKKYCCYNSRKYPGLSSEHPGAGPHPSYPDSPHKYGPVGFLPQGNYYGNRRPYGNYHSSNRYPPHGNLHYYRDDVDDYPRPHDRPYAPYHEIDFYARSLNKNETADADGRAESREKS